MLRGIPADLWDAFRARRLNTKNLDLYSTPWWNVTSNFLLVVVSIGASAVPSLKPHVPDGWWLAGIIVIGLLALLWVLSFLLREAAVKAQFALDNHNLKQTILRLPTEFRFERATELLTQNVELCREALKGGEQEDLKETILAVLAAIQQIAAAYSSVSVERIGVNIMIAYNSGHSAFQGLAEEVRFHQDKSTLAEGYLLAIHDDFWLYSQKQTADETGETGHRRRFVLFALPDCENLTIVTDGNSKKRLRVLPGAPLCFMNGQALKYCNTLEFANNCRELCDFQPSIFEEIQRYFTDDGDMFRSFACFPIGTHFPYLGVLNVDSTNEVILGAYDELLASAQALIHPLLLAMEPVLRRYLGDEFQDDS